MSRLRPVALPVKVSGQDLREQGLITVVTALVCELHPQRSRFIDVRPSSRIKRDLGIDSLGRTALILRIERAFRVRLPARTIGEAETVRDLVQALEQAGPARERVALEPRQGPPLSSVPAASEAQTLVEVLEWHAARHPDRLHLTVLQDETTILGMLTYAELSTKARNVARGLIAQDIVPGDRVTLMLPMSIDFFIAFFGILYAGAVPVPIYPPMRLSQIETRQHLNDVCLVVHSMQLETQDEVASDPAAAVSGPTTVRSEGRYARR
jgi:non-ribosomal peptide synthetase component F